LSLSLNVPPWEDLHELSRDELRLTNLTTTDAVAGVLPPPDTAAAVAAAKPLQDRFVGDAVAAETSLQPVKSTRTAEAMVPTGGIGTPAAAPQ